MVGGDDLRSRILRMREANINWEAIALELGMDVSDCQAVAHGETEISVVPAGPRGGERIFVRREIVGGSGIVLLINSLGVARTGKTTLATELAALCSARGVKVALVDADGVGHGLYHVTVPNEGNPQGLLAWEPDAAGKHRGSWLLPGSARPKSMSVDVWAMPPNAKREPVSGWAPSFWQWVRSNYSLTIVDTGEVASAWAEPAYSFADLVLYVMPQDFMAVSKVSFSAPRGTAGLGVVIMGYTTGISKMIEPSSLADILGLQLIAAIPYDARFATWQVVNSVPWFPNQANANPTLASEMEKIVPRAFRENPPPAKKRRWLS